MHDKNGTPIKVGDIVTLECVVVSTNPGEYCTTELETVEAMPGNGNKNRVCAINAAQVLLVAKSAAVALLLGFVALFAGTAVAQDPLRGLTSVEIHAMYNEDANGNPISSDQADAILKSIYTPEFWAHERKVVAERNARERAAWPMFKNALGTEGKGRGFILTEGGWVNHDGDTIALAPPEVDQDPKAAAVKGAIADRLQRAKFRTFLALKGLRAKGADKAAIQKVLNDPDLFQATYEGLKEEHAANAAGPVTDFFEWLMTNSDSIIAFIKQIISLFAQHDQAMPAEDATAIGKGRIKAFLGKIRDKLKPAGTALVESDSPFQFASHKPRKSHDPEKLLENLPHDIRIVLKEFVKEINENTAATEEEFDYLESELAKLHHQLAALGGTVAKLKKDAAAVVPTPSEPVAAAPSCSADHRGCCQAEARCRCERGLCRRHRFHPVARVASAIVHRPKLLPLRRGCGC